MKKRILGIILSMIMVVSLFSTTILAAPTTSQILLIKSCQFIGSNTINLNSPNRYKINFSTGDENKDALLEQYITKDNISVTLVAPSKNEKAKMLYGVVPKKHILQLTIAPPIPERIAAIQLEFFGDARNNPSISFHGLKVCKVKVEQSNNEKIDKIKALACDELKHLVYNTEKEVTKEIEDLYKAATGEISRQKNEEGIQIVKNKWKKRIIAAQINVKLDDMSATEVIEGAVGKIKKSIVIIINGNVVNDENKSNPQYSRKEKRKPHEHKKKDDLNFKCPNCGRVIVHRYTVDGCPFCGAQIKK